MDRAALVELFSPVIAVTVRPMFGGFGIYGPAGIFAIAVDGALFLKVDAETRPAWLAAGAGPFTYEKARGQQAVMSYFSLPEAAYDDPEILREWVMLAEDAARRAAAKGRGTALSKQAGRATKTTGSASKSPQKHKSP
jgi:DNA transformation protein